MDEFNGIAVRNLYGSKIESLFRRHRSQPFKITFIKVLLTMQEDTFLTHSSKHSKYHIFVFSIPRLRTERGNSISQQSNFIGFLDWTQKD
jgi:hypothetical protein